MVVPDSGAARDVAAAAGFTAFAGSVLLHHGIRGGAASPRHRLATWTRASRGHWFCRFLPFLPIGFNGEIFFSGTIFGPREERDSESLIQDLSGLGAQMGCTGNDFCASRDGPREFAAKRLHNVVMWIGDLSGPRSARPATDPGDLQQNASTAW